MSTDPGRDATSSASTAPELRYGRALLLHSREELRVADAKASSLFALIGTLLGITVGLAAASSWTPSELPLPAAVAAWTATALSLSGLLMTVGAIYPRTGPGVQRAPGLLAYFADVAQCVEPEDVRRGLEMSAACELDLLSEELLAVSRIAAIKYRLITRSLWTLLIAGILVVVVVVLVV